jgi:GntR family transcriptional regulator
LHFDPDNMKPIYVQIAEWLEGEILSGNIRENERIYSQYQLAELFNINPATAAKGLNILAENGIVYKKRGLGMFVEPQARSVILNNRKTKFLQEEVLDLVLEAKRLGVQEEELIAIIRQTVNRTKEEKL